MSGECSSSRRTGSESCGVHQLQQRFGLGLGKFTEEVGGVVGVHGLEDVRGALDLEVHEQVRLVVGGQFLDDVGETFVVECEGEFVAAFLRQEPHRVRDVGRAHALELREQCRDALAGHRQVGLCEALDVLPLDDVHGGAATESAAVPAHRDLRHHPVPGAGLLDAQIDDDDVGVPQLLEFRVVHAHVGIRHLGEGEHLAGPLLESAQTDVAGGECHRARFDGGDAEHRDEDAFAREQFDDQSEDARLLPADARGDHHVPDAADRLPVGAEHHQAGQPGCKNLVRSCHDCQARSLYRNTGNRTPAKVEDRPS